MYCQYSVFIAELEYAFITAHGVDDTNSNSGKQDVGFTCNYHAAGGVSCNLLLEPETLRETLTGSQGLVPFVLSGTALQTPASEPASLLPP